MKANIWSILWRRVTMSVRMGQPEPQAEPALPAPVFEQDAGLVSPATANLSNEKPAIVEEVASHRPTSSDEEIFARLERLADLCKKGVITQEEFLAKKTELLARL